MKKNSSINLGNSDSGLFSSSNSTGHPDFGTFGKASNNLSHNPSLSNVSHHHMSNEALIKANLGNLSLLQSLDDPSTMKLPPDFIGAYSPESRRQRIERFIEKRNRRVWTKKVKYDVRKNFADSRLRVKVCKTTFFRIWAHT